MFKRGLKVGRIIAAKILKHVYLLVETKKVVIVEVFSEMLANATLNIRSIYIANRSIKTNEVYSE